MQARFQLRNIYLRIHFHTDRLEREMEKLAEARQELKTSWEKA